MGETGGKEGLTVNRAWCWSVRHAGTSAIRIEIPPGAWPVIDIIPAPAVTGRTRAAAVAIIVISAIPAVSVVVIATPPAVTIIVAWPGTLADPVSAARGIIAEGLVALPGSADSPVGVQSDRRTGAAGSRSVVRQDLPSATAIGGNCGKGIEERAHDQHQKRADCLFHMLLHLLFLPKHLQDLFHSRLFS